MNFPIWMYHKTKEAQIFYSKEEFEKAGPGWVHTQAELEDKTPQPVAVELLPIVDVKPRVKAKASPALSEKVAE